MIVEERHSRRRGRPPSLVWAVILITIGVLILLSYLGVLHVNFLELWRLWPVLLILFGLEILFGYRSALGRAVVLVLTLGVMAGVVWLLVTGPGRFGAAGAASTERIEEPLGSVEQADLTVNFAAGQLALSELTDSSSLIEGTLNLATQTKPVFDLNRTNNRATMTLGYQEGQAFTSFTGGDDWKLQLSPRVGFTLDVQVAAGEARLDLTGLDVRGLKVDGAASQVTVILPATGDFSAHLEGGVGGLTLEIPAGMAARLQIDRGLSALSLPARFSEQGQYYQTSDWTTNQNRVDVQLSIGVGALTIR
jgi:hypothetical protein